LDGLLASVFDCQQTAFGDQPRSCYGNRNSAGDGDPLLDLDLFFWDHRNQYLDGARYELPLAVFDVPDDRLGPRAFAGLASFRPPNLPGWTYAWLADRFRAFGLTDTGAVAHESGHHVGLSHPHDTYDPGLDAEILPDGPFAFTWTGSETYTIMSYLPNTDEFGQFDRDHMARWQLTARLDNANRILGEIARSGRADRVATDIEAADAKAGEALTALQAWELPAASNAAADAYALVLAAADDAGVPVEPFPGIADEGPGAGPIEAATDPRDLKPRVPNRVKVDPLARYMP
jgi:hypothetical protein